MRTARFVCAAVILGLAVATAAWLASYRVIILVADSRLEPGRPPPGFTPVDSPVWWGAYLAVILLVVAISIAERLLPERARVLRRAMEHALVQPLPEPLRPRVLVRGAIRLVMKGVRLLLNALDWFVADPVRLLVKRTG